MLVQSTLFLALLSGSAHGWGDWGHESVGYIAQSFLGTQALTFVQSVLDAQYDGQLGAAATWADQVKYRKGWTWTKNLHFVDANDDPLSGSCSVDDIRDCQGNCIISAISNYTARVQDSSLGVDEQDIALKFLTHFIGDIGQPLHCEAYELGGNKIKTTFDGKHTELHAVWDTFIPEKTIKQQFGGSVQAYASSIASRIQSGDFSADAASWISCSDPTLPQSTAEGLAYPYLNVQERGENVPFLSTVRPPKHGRDLQCPLTWAQDSNELVCNAVFNGYDNGDLGDDYYTANAPIVDAQIAKSGYRLAAWLNAIFGGASATAQL